MALYHVYSQTVADGTATSVVRPSDWNSAHSQQLTLSGNTAGASTASGTNIAYQGGNNVTLSVNQGVNAATIVVSGANTVAQTIQTQAAGNIAGTGFATTTTNGVVIVGTNATNGQTLAVPPYITTYVNDLTSGRAGTGFTSASTAGSDIVATLNTNGLSVGVPKYLTTTAAQTVQPVAVSGSNGSFNFSTLTLGSSNGMHFYSTNGSIVGSYTVPTQTVDTNKAGTGFTSTTTAGTAVVGTLNTNGLSIGVPTIITNAITTAAQSNHSHAFATTTTNGSQINVATSNSNGITMAVPPFITTYVAQTTQTQPAGNIAGVGTTFAGTNVSATIGLNSNGLDLALSAPAPGGGAINVSAGTTSGNLQTIQFDNGANVSFGLNGSTITASAAPAVLSLYATTSGGSTTGNVSSMTVDARSLTFVAGSAAGVGFSTSAGGSSIIISGKNQSNQVLSFYASSNTTGSASSTTYDARSISLIGAGMISIGMNSTSAGGTSSGIVISASQSVQPVAVSGSNGSFNFSTLTMGSSNGMHFYTTNGSIVGSYTVPTQTVDTNKAGTGFTSTTTAGTAVVGTLNTNGLSIGVPTIITNAITTARASNDAIGLNTAATNVTWTVNSGGISLNAGGYLTTAAQSNHSHNLATTTTDGSLIVVATTNSAGATLAVPSFITTYAAQTNQTANFYVAGNTTQLSSTANIDVRSLSFEGAGIASVGVSNGRVLVSVPSGGGAGDGVNILQMRTDAGNTAGATFSTISGTMYLQGGNNVTLSQTSNTIVISGANAGGGGGTTVSWYPPLPLPIATSTMVTGTSGNTGGSFQTTAHLYVAPMQLQQALTFGEVEIIASHAALSAGTGSVTIGHQLGIYSLNGGSALSLVSSFAWNCVLSQNSATAITAQFWWGNNSTSNSTGITGNSSASITGPRVLKMYDSTGSLPSGDYWIAQAMTHRSSSVNIAASWFTGMFLSQSQSTAGVSYFGHSSVGNIMRNMGIVSTTQNNAGSLTFAMPVSIHTSAITGTGGTSQMRIPVPRFYL